MKGRISTLAAIAALILLSVASPLSAAAKAGATPLKIDVTGRQALGNPSVGKFSLIGASTADTDSGVVTRRDNLTVGLKPHKSSNGQTFNLNSSTSTFKGKRGTLVLHSTGKTYQMDKYEVWMGTWKIVSGTGTYAGLQGTGGFTAVIPMDEETYTMRYEGLATRS